ncbi:MAG: HD-GYP domain-containing protein [Candidatus Eisenbacteria bacterium]
MGTHAKEASKLPPRCQSLLESAARMTGMWLEVWNGGRDPLASAPVPPSCRACGRRDLERFSVCRRERARAVVTGCAGNPEGRGSVCPRGRKILCVPIAMADAPWLRLVACVNGHGHRHGEVASADGNGRGGAAHGSGNGNGNGNGKGSGNGNGNGNGNGSGNGNGKGNGNGNGRSASVNGNGSGNGSGRGADESRIRFLEDLAALFAEHLSFARSLTHATGELTHRHEELDLLYTISGSLRHAEGVRSPLRRILEQARVALVADAVVLSIDSSRVFEQVSGPSLGNGKAPGGRDWRLLSSFLAERFRDGALGFFEGAPADLPGMDGRLAVVQRLLAVPLPGSAGNDGCLCLAYMQAERRRGSSEVRLLKLLAEKVSMAVANDLLVEDLHDFLMATVKSLVSAIEAKDPYTSGHSERVNLLSMLLGKTMGLSAADLEVLRWASILHDVGKIGMPEEILKKPGILTPEEYEVMKEHPDRGYKVLAPIRQLEAASLGVRHHHEMFDGRGYPLGLKGEAIPLPARIISVADTYDALTSTRSYRKRRGPDQAFAIIQAVRGTQLDPRVVDTLAELMPFIREHEVMLQPEGLEGAPLTLPSQAA